jgi:hypothetical protein
VFEDPDKPLLPFEVGGDRRSPGDATREGRSIEEDLSPVHRHSHRFQGRHQAVELGPTRDGTRGEFLLGRIEPAVPASSSSPTVEIAATEAGFNTDYNGAPAARP